MHNRRFGVLISAALLLMVTACSGGGNNGVTTLRFLSLAWQKDSVRANKEIVAEWNRTHPTVQVKYEQGSWDTVHDQLLTSFEGDEAPDIIHDETDDIADFAYDGYLANISTMIGKDMKADIPANSWQTATFDKGIYGVPFLQEPKVIIANRKALNAAGVRIPGAGQSWSWQDFQAAAAALSKNGNYGVAWPMKEPVSLMLNLSLGSGGPYFYTKNGKTSVRFGPNEQRLPELVRNQVIKTKTAAPTSLGMGGSDTLPGFFAGKYGMVVLGLSYRQQVIQQAPKGFDWVTLPLPSGTSAAQGVSPQTLSVAAQSKHQQAAMDFIHYMLSPANVTRLALGDWMLPTSRKAMSSPAITTAKNGWDVGVDMAGSLREMPSQQARGYAEWMDKIATPAFQEYFRGQIDINALREKLTGDGNRVLARYER